MKKKQKQKLCAIGTWVWRLERAERDRQDVVEEVAVPVLLLRTNTQPTRHPPERQHPTQHVSASVRCGSPGTPLAEFRGVSHGGSRFQGTQLPAEDDDGPGRRRIKSEGASLELRIKPPTLNASRDPDPQATTEDIPAGYWEGAP